MPAVAPALTITRAVVPCLWPGQTIVCVGAGPSLTREDVAYCHRRAPVVVVNDAYRYAPWAEVLFAADAKWWRWKQEIPDDCLPPLKYTVTFESQILRPSVQLLVPSGQSGIAATPDRVRTGGHSGYAAINLAAHLVGAGGRIVLLGYDMQCTRDGRHHFFGEHPDANHLNYAHRMGAYAGLKAALTALDISIVNCTPRTAIPTGYLPRDVLSRVF